MNKTQTVMVVGDVMTETGKAYGGLGPKQMTEDEFILAMRAVYASTVAYETTFRLWLNPKHNSFDKKPEDK